MSQILWTLPQLPIKYWTECKHTFLYSTAGPILGIYIKGYEALLHKPLCALRSHIMNSFPISRWRWTLMLNFSTRQTLFCKTILTVLHATFSHISSVYCATSVATVCKCSIKTFETSWICWAEMEPVASIAYWHKTNSPIDSCGVSHVTQHPSAVTWNNDDSWMNYCEPWTAVWWEAVWVIYRRWQNPAVFYCGHN